MGSHHCKPTSFATHYDALIRLNAQRIANFTAILLRRKWKYTKKHFQYLSIPKQRVIMVSLTTPCLCRWSMKRGYVIFWVVSKLIIIAYETKCQTNFQYLCICLQAPCFGDILRNKSICILRENFCIFVDSSFWNTHRCLQEKCHTSVCNRFWNTFSRNNIGKKSRDVLYSSRIA